MIIGKPQPRLSQARIDDLRSAAIWARGEAAERRVETAEWMKAMAAARDFDVLADELQVELDAGEHNATLFGGS